MSGTSQTVRQNACYSVLDYIAQPALMLVAAPLLLRELGIQQYGTWMLVNAIAATASGLGGGFSDGATKYVSMYRGRGDHKGAARSVSAVLIVNCMFGAVAAFAMIVSAPWLIAHTFHVPENLQHVGIVSVRISAALLLVRFAEGVFISAVRGCERYRPMVVISILGRTTVVFAALLLAVQGLGLVAILFVTLLTALATLTGQAILAVNSLEANLAWRWAEIRAGVREVFSFGTFTWLKATLGVSIGYADRLLVAALLGTGALAFYSLCNQLTQPLHALIAAAFNFLFPSLSAQTASGRWVDARRMYENALRLSIAIVAVTSTLIVLLAKPILRIWIGRTAATEYYSLLIVMAIGNGVLAISVVPHYVALALGRARALTFVNLAAGVLSLGSAYLLIRQVGVVGAGVARIIAGIVFLYVFAIVRADLSEHIARAPKPSAASSVAIPSTD